MKKFIFLLFICIVTMLTGCPKSTPKQPEVFNKFNGKEGQILEEFDNEIAKYECLMSGRNWSENSVSSLNQQKLANLDAENTRIAERLQSLATEINKIQEDYQTEEKNLLGERDVLERNKLIAGRWEDFNNQLRRYKQQKLDFEAELQIIPRRQTTRRNRIQQQINSLQQYINELENQLRTGQTPTESSDVIELQIQQLQNRRDRNKTFKDTELGRKEAERDELNKKLEKNSQDQQNVLVALQQEQASSSSQTDKSANRKIYAGCLNGGNGQPTDQQKALARTVRDRMIYRLIRFTDYQYFRFENELYVKRSTGSFLADVLDVGANLAGTITNGERAKTIINASIIAFRGGRKSGSIQYFQEQTADVLITNMQTARNEVLADMIDQLKKQGVDSYPLDAALGDVIDYFYAGTLPRALQQLKKDAGVKAQNAEDEVRVLKGIKVRTPATPANAVLSVSAFDVLNGLAKISASKTASQSEKTEALSKLQKIAEQIKKNKTITDVLEKDEDLKKLLGALTTDFADGVKLANNLQDLRSGRDDKPDEATIQAIENIIINVDNTK